MGQHNSNFELASEARRAAERCEPLLFVLEVEVAGRLTVCAFEYSASVAGS